MGKEYGYATPEKFPLFWESSNIALRPTKALPSGLRDFLTQTRPPSKTRSPAPNEGQERLAEGGHISEKS